jgi:hypothetical protein
MQVFKICAIIKEINKLVIGRGITPLPLKDKNIPILKYFISSISSVNTVDDVSMDFERTIAVCEEEVMRAEKGIVGYHV